MRKIYPLLLIGLVGVAVCLGVWIFMSAPGLPSSWRRVIGETVGLEVLRQDTREGRVEERDVGVAWHEAKGVWDKPLTVFAEETIQQGDGHILSRGYGADGFERVMIRGKSLDTVRIKPYNGV